jgi:hypothetical protein
MRHAASKALLVTWLALLPGAAQAQLDLATVELEVAIDGTAGVDTLFQVTVRITGTDIASASITTTGQPPLAIPCPSATECTTTQNLANQAALNALIPTTATNYKIDPVGSEDGAPTLTDTFSFARPVVASPAISEPLNGTSVDPGQITIRFVACGTCNAATRGTVLQDGSPFEERLNLPASSTSWLPTMPFPANSSFTAKIEHATESTQNQTADGPAAGTDDDPYTFTSRVSHSDMVDFMTGFASPEGNFCIIVNDPTMTLFDTGDCDGLAYVEAPASGVFDPSGMYALTAAGIPVLYSVQMNPKGKLTGIADADVGDDGSFETPGELKGRLKGKDGRLRQKTKMRFDAASDTRFSVGLRETAQLLSLASSPDLDWLVDQKTSGKVAGTKVKERSTSTRTVPDAVTAWKLAISLSGSSGSTLGSVELASGLAVALTGKLNFDTADNDSDVKLQSQGAERGVRVRVKNLVIDSTQTPARLASGDVRFKGFGQRANVLATTPPPPPTTTTTTTPTTTTTTTTTAP